MRERENDLCKPSEYDPLAGRYKCDKTFNCPSAVCPYRVVLPFRNWGNYCTDPDVNKQARARR